MAEAVFKVSGEGGRVDHPLGDEIVVKVRGEQSGGTLTAFETVVPPGQGPPLHRHPNEDETLYVLAGEFRFRVGDRDETGAGGAFVFVPRGTAHTFQNVGEGPGAMLIHFTPAGMERFFESFAAMDEGGPEGFAAAAAKAGMEVVGPPLARRGSDPSGSSSPQQA